MQSKKETIVWLSQKSTGMGVEAGAFSNDFLVVLDDMRRVLSRILGRTLTLSEGGCFSLRFVRLSEVLDEYAVDAFRIEVDGTGMTLSAVDERGWTMAVYWILGKWVGVRWIWPGADGECLPDVSEIRIPSGIQTVIPDFVWRDIGPGGPVWQSHTVREAEKAMGVESSMVETFHLWMRRNLMGGLRAQDGHQAVRLLDPRVYGKEHPEYFALVGAVRQSEFENGKHGNQLCTSNPEVIETVAANVCHFFRMHPHIEMLSISPNDGGGFCECLDCRAQDPVSEEALQGDFAAFKEGGAMNVTRSITDRIFKFANAVAERVFEEFRDRRLLLLVYSAYRDPPRETALHPMVIAQFCCQCSRYGNDEVRQSDIQSVEALSEWTWRRGIYEYFEQGAWPGIVRLFPQRIAESVKLWHSKGFRYYSTQGSWGFAVGAPNYYILAAMLWETDQDWREILRGFCEHGFGSAAVDLQHYFTAFADRWESYQAALRGLKGDTSAQGGGYRDVGQLYPSDFLATMRALLDRARAKLTDYPIQSGRVAFVARGLEFTEAYVWACRELVSWCEAGGGNIDADGVIIIRREWMDSKEKKEWLERILEQWTALDRIIAEARKEPTLSFFWLRYHRDVRKQGEPLKSLRAALGLASDLN